VSDCCVERALIHQSQVCFIDKRSTLKCVPQGKLRRRWIAGDLAEFPVDKRNQTRDGGLTPTFQRARSSVTGANVIDQHSVKPPKRKE